MRAGTIRSNKGTPRAGPEHPSPYAQRELQKQTHHASVAPGSGAGQRVVNGDLLMVAKSFRASSEQLRIASCDTFCRTVTRFARLARSGRRRELGEADSATGWRLACFFSDGAFCQFDPCC